MSFAYLKPFNKKRLLLKMLNDYCLIDTKTVFFRPNWGLQFTSHSIHLILHSPYLRVRCMHGMRVGAKSKGFACYRCMSRKRPYVHINDNILTNLLLTAFLHFCYTRSTVALANFNTIYGFICMYWQSIWTFTIDLSTTFKESFGQNMHIWQWKWTFIAEFFF